MSKKISRFGVPAAVIAALALSACGNNDRLALKQFCDRALARGDLPAQCRDTVAQNSGIMYVPNYGYYWGGYYYPTPASAYNAWGSYGYRNPGSAMVTPTNPNVRAAPTMGAGSYETSVAPRVSAFSSRAGYSRGSVGGTGVRSSFSASRGSFGGAHGGFGGG